MIHILGSWLHGLQAQDPERTQGFTQAFPELRAELIQFGSLLEELDGKGAEVPDALFQAATNLLQVLDILWDAAHGLSGAEDFVEAHELLGCSLVVLNQEGAIVENLFESLASEQSGMDL